MLAMRSLPPVPLLDRLEDKRPAATPTTKSGEAPAEEPVAGFFRHGVEITVRGTYLDLVAYLASLEQLPMQVFWRDVEVKTAEESGITMKLTLFTVSFDKTYLVV
jgi:MSHA biogenesis protein MshJ